MKSKEKEQTFTKISWILFSIAIILILFSLVAPLIFTTCSSNWDFTDTGQIGDTIGGIMNPFIAIGGVIATFLAFFMQIQANKIQRTQFIKSLNKGVIDEKIDCYNKLQLLNLDIMNTIYDINNRIDHIEFFFIQQKENPFTLAKTERATLNYYNRVANMERLSTYKGFKIFLSHDKDWIIQFNNLYSSLDYLPEAFKEIYDIIDYHNKDVYEDKIKIRNMLVEFDEKCVEILNSKSRVDSNYRDANTIIKSLQDNYRSMASESMSNTVDFDFLKFNACLKIFNEQLYDYLSKKDNYDEMIYNMTKFVANILLQINLVLLKSNQLFPEFSSFKSRMSVGDGSIKQKLLNLSRVIEDNLSKTSIEEISKEYNELPNYIR